jgi:hypothetical protein
MEPGRRVVAGLTGTALLLIAAGVAIVLIDVGIPGGRPTQGQGPTSSHVSASPGSPLPTPSPTGSGLPGTPLPTVTPTPTPSPTPSPHPPGFAQTSEGIVYYTTDGTAVPVRAVPGLRAQLVGGRVFYTALASNRYGLVNGSYAGEFKPNVTMQQADGSSAQTGGVVLAGPVASRLISDRLAAIQDPADRWVVALPIDIRSASQTVDVTFDEFGLHGLSDTPRVVVRFVGSLPLVNVIPANGGYHALVEQLNVTRWQVIDPVRLTLPANKIDPTHPMNQLLMYGSGAPSASRDMYYDHRVVVGQRIMNVADEVSVSLVVRGSRVDLGPDKVLKIGDVPVFVASS